MDKCVMNFYPPKDLKARIEKLAAEDMRATSQMIVKILTEYADKHEVNTHP